MLTGGSAALIVMGVMSGFYFAYIQPDISANASEINAIKVDLHTIQSDVATLKDEVHTLQDTTNQIYRVVCHLSNGSHC